MAAEDSLGNAVLGTEVSLKGLDQGISDAEARAESGFSHIGNIISGALKVGLAAAAAGVVAFGAVLKGGIDDARAHQLVMAQTEQTIASMGNAAGVSAEHVESFAASLSAASGKSLFGDDQIQAAENMLLTFGNIKGATLDLATTLTVDMAQALHKTPEDMSIMVGKILNSADAMSAAQRQGVSFSDEQLKLGKRLFETGHIAEYQQLVLSELNKEFGGQAEAAAKADGGWAQFHDRLGEAAETMGAAVLPLLSELAGFLNDTIAPAVEDATQLFADLVSDFQSGGLGVVLDDIREMTGLDLSPLVSAFSDLTSAASAFLQGDVGGGFDFLSTILPPDVAATIADGVSLILDSFDRLKATFTDAATPVEGFLNVLSEVSPAFALLYGVAQEVLPQVQELVTTVFGDIAAAASENGPQMLGEVQATWQSVHDTVLSLVEPLAGVVSAVLAQISAFWAANGQDILATVQTDFSEVNSIIQDAMELIKLIVVPALQFIAQLISDHGTEIQAVLSAVWENVKSIIDIALALIGGIIRTALALVKGDWAGAWEEVKGTTDRVWKDIQAIINNTLGPLVAVITGAWEEIKTSAAAAWENVKGTVNTKLSELANTIKGLPGQVAGVGEAIVQMIWNGIRAKWGELEAWFQNQLQGLRNMLPFSEPKDSSSPLYGLSKSGESIIEQILIGLRRRGGDLAEALGADLGTVTNELRATLTGVGADVYDTTDSFRELLQSLGLTWEQTNAADDALHQLGATLQDAGPGSDAATAALDDLMRHLGLSGSAADQLRAQIAQLAGATDRAGDQMSDSARQISQAMIDDMAGRLEDSDLPDTARDLGADIIQGLRKGIEDQLQGALRQMEDVADKMLEKLKDVHDIDSPSKAFAELGAMDIQGWLQGFLDAFPDLVDTLTGLGDDLLDKAQSIADDIASALQSGFEAEASIDRQKARDIKALEDVGAAAYETAAGISRFTAEGHRDMIRQQLADAQKAAAAMNDPQEAAKFYKMRSSQIFELAKLQQDLASAGTDAERDRIRQQIKLITAAQEAEQNAFNAGQAKTGSSDLERLAKTIQDFLLNDKLPGALEDTSGVLQRLFDLLQQINKPPPAPQQGAAMLGVGGIGGLANLSAGGLAGQSTSISISVDARGAIDVRAVEEAGYRGTKRALDEAGVRADVYQRTRR